MNTENKKTKPVLLDIQLEKANEYFSKKVIESGSKPGRYRAMPKPEGYARVSSTCGDTIEMFLRLKNGRIEDASFTSEGCMTTVAAAQAAAEMATGRTLKECLAINQASITVYLDGLPEGNEHCAYLAALALHRALRNYAVHRRGV